MAILLCLANKGTKASFDMLDKFNLHKWPLICLLLVEWEGSIKCLATGRFGQYTHTHRERGSATQNGISWTWKLVYYWKIVHCRQWIYIWHIQCSFMKEKQLYKCAFLFSSGHKGDSFPPRSLFPRVSCRQRRLCWQAGVYSWKKRSAQYRHCSETDFGY